MAATTLVSVNEYLRTSFPDGDREYVDGRIVERNMGEVDHSDVQSNALFYLKSHYRKLWAGVEVRVQVKATRFRVPDVAVMEGGKPKSPVVKMPPFLVIEVLSPDDRAIDLESKLDDYFAFGVKYVWVINPETRRGFIHTPKGSREAKDGVLRTQNPEIQVPLADLFS